MPILLFLVMLAAPMELALWLTLHGYGWLGLLVIVGMTVGLFKYATRRRAVPVPVPVKVRE